MFKNTDESNSSDNEAELVPLIDKALVIDPKF